ncbi:MAG: nucleotidyl transferase AbiEii/AbiGii toxin family protein [Deltaproteobacteria bacterium]|nr:nucleotidyl transferase AbiEii/AbiGii toxin family protein [Deltaproteobacteria bacterium]
MSLAVIQQHAEEKGVSFEESAQIFMQAIVLKHLALPTARLIGGGALVFGHGNPRFSEDVDLTQVSDPRQLETGLRNAAAELEKWFGKSVTLSSPKSDRRTWRLLCRLSPARTLRLHVDSQPYPAYTVHAVVIQFPSIPSFVCESIGLEEIMAEKMIAVANRRYLGGRDLFDLWFHWLRQDHWEEMLPTIRSLVIKKLKDRSITPELWIRNLSERLSPGKSLKRAEEEWRRYLPVEFQKKLVHQEILKACYRLPEVFSE